MTLKRYREKRNFKSSPEPYGKQKSAADKGLKFVIQKHASSHLHYDFRLEWDGVLKSWAVPKGPSLSPRVKRLAIEVEDHPLDYGSFEGMIPDGEYGGGAVIIWDRGTWHTERDIAKAFLHGRLDFELKGEKLQGRWHLIRTSISGERKHWLLMKETDAYASDSIDVTQERPESVKSGKLVNEIEKGKTSKKSPKKSTADGKVKSKAKAKTKTARTR